jgi:hypothetical protein
MPQLEDTTPYRVKDQYHSQGRTIRVINVGAGAAGLLVRVFFPADECLNGQLTLLKDGLQNEEAFLRL